MVTVRLPVLRPGLPLLVLVVFVHTVLGFVLACHAPVDRPVVVAAAEVDRQVGGCPGCLRDDRVGAVRSITAVTPADTATSGTAPAFAARPTGSSSCSSDWPCQHGPQDGHQGDVAVRGLGVPRDGGCLLAVCVEPRLPTPRAGEVSVSGPVPPPAVRAPVAVLGVDRN